MRGSKSNNKPPPKHWHDPVRGGTLTFRVRKGRTVFDDETIRPTGRNATQAEEWYDRVRADFWYRHQMPVIQRALLNIFGYKSFKLFEDIRRPFFAKLWGKIPEIENRKIILISSGTGRGSRGDLPYFITTDPPDTPPKISSLCHYREWSLFAKCRSCGNNKFLPLFIDDKPHVACYQCLSPDQFSTIGGTLADISLIMQEARKYY